MKKEKRAILFSNGEAQNPERLQIRADDYLIAVDGGLKHLEKLGLSPDLLIGDLDSVDSQDLQNLESSSVEVLRFNPQKDDTDLALALREAIKRGFQRIVIAFGLGGRVDHLLASLGLLEVAKTEAIEIYFDDGTTRVFLFDDEITLDAEPQDLISLIPWRGDALVHETQNLAYALRDEWLPFGTSRGVSNLALAQTIRVSLSKGELLVIHTKTNADKA
ncbi:MAG TPA: thiamine diphosphokinase [Anaerolineaceae bacterium]|nr:thiamine diphosphokinase [Anaerolineaceae bacterium]